MTPLHGVLLQQTDEQARDAEMDQAVDPIEAIKQAIARRKSASRSLAAKKSSKELVSGSSSAQDAMSGRSLEKRHSSGLRVRGDNSHTRCRCSVVRAWRAACFPSPTRLGSMIKSCGVPTI